ncbi:MAG: nucleotidyltransferase family protein [Coriobacteriia bacterium]|nr:nucleotidyltransferase family protein [Coriobacteriia bacterium]
MEERVRDLLVSPESTIREALHRLDASAMRIALICDEDARLQGVLSDGDVRRWILAGRGLDEPVASAANTSPITVADGASRSDAEALMVAHKIDLVPVLDPDGRVVAIVRWTDLFEEPSAPRRALGMPVVIMAGGQGTRLAPFTSILPKPLIPLGDRPIIEHIMERFAAHGCNEFLVSLNYKANLIKAYFADEDLPHDIEFVDEERSLGTGGSLSLMRRHLDRPFFVTNCDVLVDADYGSIEQYHRESGNLVTVVASMKHVTIPYGVCEIKDGGRLTAITEKPQFDFLVSTGFYVMDPCVLADVPDDTFYHVTDLVSGYLQDGRRVGVYPVSEKSWLDIGQIEELRETLVRFGAEQV